MEWGMHMHKHRFWYFCVHIARMMVLTVERIQHMHKHRFWYFCVHIARMMVLTVERIEHM
jgi:hypothetical protein